MLNTDGENIDACDEVLRRMYIRKTRIIDVEEDDTSNESDTDECISDDSTDENTLIEVDDSEDYPHRKLGRLGRDVMKLNLTKNEINKAQSLVDLFEYVVFCIIRLTTFQLREFSGYCKIEMRMMFYSQTCPNTFDIHKRVLLRLYTDMAIDGQYQFEWFAGLFFVDLAKN